MNVGVREGVAVAVGVLVGLGVNVDVCEGVKVALGVSDGVTLAVNRGSRQMGVESLRLNGSRVFPCSS